VLKKWRHFVEESPEFPNRNAHSDIAVVFSRRLLNRPIEALDHID
jgi:hypothetical protein